MICKCEYVLLKYMYTKQNMIMYAMICGAYALFSYTCVNSGTCISNARCGCERERDRNHDPHKHKLTPLRVNPLINNFEGVCLTTVILAPGASEGGLGAAG